MDGLRTRVRIKCYILSRVSTCDRTHYLPAGRGARLPALPPYSLMLSVQSTAPCRMPRGNNKPGRCSHLLLPSHEAALYHRERVPPLLSLPSSPRLSRLPRRSMGQLLLLPQRSTEQPRPLMQRSMRPLLAPPRAGPGWQPRCA